MFLQSRQVHWVDAGNVAFCVGSYAYTEGVVAEEGRD